MSLTKRVLILLGSVDALLIIMSLMDYYILFLKPTGFVFPMLLNIIVLAVIGFRSRFHKGWTIAFLTVSIPALLIHSVMVWLMENQYATIESPENKSVTIEYRSFTLGETTYLYEFYKTSFGFIGKHLDDQTIKLIIQGKDHPTGLGAEDALGLGTAEWITDDTVRFSTWQGIKELSLNSSRSSGRTEDITSDIESFMTKLESKESGDTINVNGNRLVAHYDEATDQPWIEITADNDEGAIPRQQCTRIVRDEERGYYLLEECTHRWEYPLYPLNDS
ncbi:hypothetical protein [Rossellomorea aquimaris]|uniref:hypothetical protein n=1 Tax=Rossellomorea aquimaris TaxID=189382 RepID=UPI0006980D6B|nr:hypothetical protein [Rossellomorea aquimaris]